jgi:hypothetical protein
MADTTAGKYVKSGQSGNPGQLSFASQTMQARTQMLRAVYGGTETMRAQGTAFLPQYDRETDVRYQARLGSVFALNKFREAVDAASAKPFRTLLQVKNNTDPDLDLWVQDADLLGNHLHIFAHQFFNNALIDGVCHIMVDHPTTENLPNLAVQQNSTGIRPFMKLITSNQLVAAYEENIGGDIQVTHARILGARVERTADFREIPWNQLYVIEKDPASENGIAQLWEQRAAGGGGGGGGWSFVAETPITIPEVPLVTLYAGEKESSMIARSPFVDLAYKQIEHWISSADQRSILAAGRFPMLACSGVQIDEGDEAGFAIGPYKVLYSPDAQGRWYFVEPKGSAIASGQKDLEMIEMHMDIMALNPVTGTHRQYVPQNERDIQETRVHSVIHDLAYSCQDGIEKAIKFMGMWTGKDFSTVQALLNTEFANTKDRLNEVTQLISLWEKRGISREVLLKEIQNRSVFEEGFDIAAELAKFAKVDEMEANGDFGMLSGRWTQIDPTKMPADPSLALGTPVPAAPGSTPVKPPPKSQVDLPPPGQNRPGLKQI